MTTKLMLGDCLERMAAIEDGSIDMVLTDPPYGTTGCKWDSVIPLKPMWEHLKRVAKPNAAIVLTASQPFTTTLIASNRSMFRYCWTWEKEMGTGFLHAKSRPLKNTEEVVVFSRQQSTYNPQMRLSGLPYRCGQGRGSEVYNNKPNAVVSTSNGERYPVTTIKFDRDKGHHPTQKPVKLMEYLVKTYTDEGETVLDFTMGSGTTGVACYETRREFIGIEMDPGYYAIAKKRIKRAKTNHRLFAGIDC